MSLDYRAQLIDGVLKLVSMPKKKKSRIIQKPPKLGDLCPECIKRAVKAVTEKRKMKELKVMKKALKKGKTMEKAAKKKVKHEKQEVKAHRTLRGSRIY